MVPRYRMRMHGRTSPLLAHSSPPSRCLWKLQAHMTRATQVSNVKGLRSKPTCLSLSQLGISLLEPNVGRYNG